VQDEGWGNCKQQLLLESRPEGFIVIGLRNVSDPKKQSRQNQQDKEGGSQKKVHLQGLTLAFERILLSGVGRRGTNPHKLYGFSIVQSELGYFACFLGNKHLGANFFGKLNV
jgi:hypothetical protein